jgi:hypothetical protein
MARRVAQWKSPQLINSRLDFEAGNLWARTDSYSGDYVIYSYNAEIARVLASGIVWVSTRKWSNTTSSHQFYTRQGLSGEDIIWARTLDHAKTTTKWRDLVGN